MLLETARDLIERDGEAALTLGAIADEAGLAHATVYGYFTGKRDLLSALGSSVSQSSPAELVAEAAKQADEPESVAEAEPPAVTTVGEIVPAPVIEVAAEQPSPAEAPNVEPPLDAIEPVAEAAINEPEPSEESENRGEAEIVSDPAESVSGSPEQGEITVHLSESSEPEVSEQPAPVEDAVADDDHKVLTPFERDRHQQAAHLEEIAKRLILPESALREGTDAVISRLETRMKVLERSIASLESRHNTIADESDRKLKPVSELVAKLQTRADAAEDRLRQALAELRLHVHELKARQDRMDGGSPSAVADMPVWPEPVPEPVSATTEADASPQEKVSDESAETTQEQDSKLAYLANVRNLAKEGARQAAERETVEEEEQGARKRKLLTAGGVALISLILAGLLFRFHPGDHGVSAAQSKAVAPVTVHAKTQSSLAPLDRLSAMAAKGDARAELVIGLKYLKGDGIAANDAEAARWLERAAQAGDAVAQNHLGALYQAGRGVKADPQQAIHWYQAAAAQGGRHAMSNLAVLYAGGAGGPANFAEATRWFQRSASLGFVDAQFNLAVLYERGDGVPQSLLDAYKWYSIAAVAGDAVAKTRADAIATQVSPEELQAARLAASHFTPQPLNHAANDEPSMAQVLASR
jgi:TPR repeat protein